MLNIVPETWRTLGLFLVNLLRVTHVEAQEIDQLTRSVDLCLVSRFTTVEHGTGVHLGTVFHGQKLRRFEEDARSFLPAKFLPLFLGRDCAVDRQLHFCRTCLVVSAQNMLVVVGHDDLAEIPGPDFLAADDNRNLHLP